MPKKQANFNQNKPKNKQVFKKKTANPQKNKPKLAGNPKVDNTAFKRQMERCYLFSVFFHTCP